MGRVNPDPRRLRPIAVAVPFFGYLVIVASAVW
jgi:hypothetical protein